MSIFIIIFVIILAVGLTYYGAELCFNGNPWGFLVGFLGSALLGIVLCFIMYEKYKKNNDNVQKSEIVKHKLPDSKNNNIDNIFLQNALSELEKLNSKLSFQNSKLRLREELKNNKKSGVIKENLSTLNKEIINLKEEIEITKVEIITCKNKINFLKGEN
ncbi:hypothetical protein [Mesoplasma florum]|uniref:hypothetical protein n=1 Tax=Mesoplasma florum TaxID=2151 RepID=UPI000BE24D2D|nr:hypothetical protein [Mesoplasma florum]ATI73453.1 hypothetical protein CQZ69_02690 [Mesoplasma florum]AVN61846.1 hypothetical protein CG004_02675 [Mesoplasma florum]